MKPLEKLIRKIVKKHLELKWMTVGAKRDTSQRIYTARTNNFEIKVSLRDYSKHQHFWQDKVMRMKGMTSQIRIWAEVTVIDHDGRFGRRIIARREVIYPQDPCFKTIAELIKSIDLIATVPINESKKDDRLSIEHALLATCEAL
jgi:predicted DNA binding protein